MRSHCGERAAKHKPEQQAEDRSFPCLGRAGRFYSAAMLRQTALIRPAFFERLRRHLALAAPALIAVLALCCAVQAAQAQVAGAAIVLADESLGIGAAGGALEQQIRQLALAGTPAGPTSGGTDAPRFEVSVGQLDARLRLAPCQHVEPYLPEGMRLWGKARIGLRCTQGATKWNVFLPVTVKAYGAGLVALGNLPAGSVLTAADLTQSEVDLAEDASPVLANADLAVGRTLARPVKAGQGLRQSHIKARQWFAAGDSVIVVAQGSGFSVAGEGQALTNGVEGQPARVRTEGGRVLTGFPVGERRLELAL